MSPKHVDKPLTREELGRLKPVRANAKPPAGTILSGQQSLLFSGPAGQRPKLKTRYTRIAGTRKRDIWRVDVEAAGLESGVRVPLRMDRVHPRELRPSARERSDALEGYRPPWAQMSFLQPKAEKPAPPMLRVKNRKARPLYIFNDRRKAVTNGNYPWWSIGMVTSNRGTGTGALIGSSIFLTAGHVVPWDAKDPFMNFSPAWNIPDVSFGIWPAVRAQGYVVGNPPGDFDTVAHDVAVVQLETSLGDTLGYLGAKVYQDRWDDTGYWTSVGYPDDWNGFPEFEDADTVEDSDSEEDADYLETEASLTHGNSGGPFFGWWQSGNTWLPYVVGVVSSEGAEAEIPQDHDNFLAGGDALVNLIAWGRANLK